MRHRSGEAYQKMYAALKIPKNTVTSIILKWKKSGTTKTLPGRLVRFEMNGAKYREILDENLLQSTQDHSLG